MRPSNFNFDAIKVVGLDADDTLWVNETYFREAELEVSKLLAAYETANTIDQELFKKEIENLPLYGYGIKGFTLSMIEMALELSNYNISNQSIEAIINIGKDMLNKPVELLDGVEHTLKELSKTHKLVLVTKGDLLDQERKLEKSKLTRYFHHIEVLSDKKESNYEQLLKSLDIVPSEFLMVGNSLTYAVLPLIGIGAHAAHIPFHTTWLHEEVDRKEANGKDYTTLQNLTELLTLLHEKN